MATGYSETVRKWKKSRSPSAHSLMEKRWCTHMTGYYLTTVQDVILIHATQWRKHENSERSQKQKSYITQSIYIKSPELIGSQRQNGECWFWGSRWKRKWEEIV